MAETQPTVQVWSNGIQASCGVSGPPFGQACYFQYDDALTPAVSAVSRSSITAGDELVITGTGFGPVTSDNVVSIGNVSTCAVTSCSSTELRCIVDHTPAGAYNISVLILYQSRGYARVSSSVSQLVYALVIASVSQTAGSMFGGTLLTFSGTGFPANRPPPSSYIRFVGTSASCVIVDWKITSATCRTPPRSAVLLAGGYPTETASPSFTASLSVSSSTSQTPG